MFRFQFLLCPFGVLLSSKFLSLVFLFFCFTQTGFSQKLPTPEEVKKVTDYYFNRSPVGPVLVDAKVCNDYVREGRNKLQCRFENRSRNISYGNQSYVWLNFFWNAEQSYTITVDYILEDKIRSTYDHILPKGGSVRYRLPLKFQANLKGDWTVNISYEKNGKPVLLKTMEITVR